MKPAEKDSWSPTSLLIRLMVAGTVLAIWFWTQSLLGARTAPETGVADALHNLTAGWNAYLAHHAAAANVLLILSSAIIDALGVFLLGSWLFGRRVRPFLGLVMLMILGQVAGVLLLVLVRAGGVR